MYQEIEALDLSLIHIWRATSLAKKATLRVSVDSMENVKELALAAQDQGVIIGIVVEVDIGNKRSGVRTEDEAVDIARFAELSSNLRYDGIMGYEGHCVFINDLAEREKCARLAYERLFFYKEALASKGLPPSIVTAGGTGSYPVSYTHLHAIDSLIALGIVASVGLVHKATGRKG